MTLGEDIFDRCTTHAGTAALIGSRCYKRIPREPAVPIVYPLLTYQAPISDDDSEYRTHDTGSVERTVSRVQFNCYDSTDNGASALADQLRLAWSGYKDGCTIGRAHIANVLDAGWNDNLKNYRYIVDVMIEHPIVT